MNTDRFWATVNRKTVARALTEKGLPTEEERLIVELICWLPAMSLFFQQFFRLLNYPEVFSNARTHMVLKLQCWFIPALGTHQHTFKKKELCWKQTGKWHIDVSFCIRHCSAVVAVTGCFPRILLIWPFSSSEQSQDSVGRVHWAESAEEKPWAHFILGIDGAEGKVALNQLSAPLFVGQLCGWNGPCAT